MVAGFQISSRRLAGEQRSIAGVARATARWSRSRGKSRLRSSREAGPGDRKVGRSRPGTVPGVRSGRRRRGKPTIRAIRSRIVSNPWRTRFRSGRICRASFSGPPRPTPGRHAPPIPATRRTVPIVPGIDRGFPLGSSSRLHANFRRNSPFDTRPSWLSITIVPPLPEASWERRCRRDPRTVTVGPPHLKKAVICMSIVPALIPTPRLHADRAAGRHRHHRRPDRPAPARRAGRPRGRPPDPVRQQHEAAVPGRAELPRHQRGLPRRFVFGHALQPAALSTYPENFSVFVRMLPFFEQTRCTTPRTST